MKEEFRSRMNTKTKQSSKIVSNLVCLFTKETYLEWWSLSKKLVISKNNNIKFWIVFSLWTHCINYHFEIWLKYYFLKIHIVNPTKSLLESLSLRFFSSHNSTESISFTYYQSVPRCYKLPPNQTITATLNQLLVQI